MTAEAASETEVSVERLPRATVLGLLLASAQAPLGSTLASVGLPDLSRELTIALAVATPWLVTSYLVVNIVGQSPGGKLADLLGSARTVRFGILLQAVAACAGALSSMMPALVLARVGMALGSALVIPATFAVLRQRTPESEHGRMFGLVSATMGLSAAVGPALGGELVARIGWRAMFVAPFALTLMAGALLAWAGLPEPRARGRGNRAPPDWRDVARNFDSLGSVLLAAWLVALFAFSRVQNAAAFAVFALAFAAFLARERRTAQPVFDLGLFAQRGFTTGSVLIALQNFTVYGLLFLLPGYFEHVRGANPAVVGRTLFAMMFGMFTMAPIGGRLCDHFGARTSAAIGIVPLLSGMWLLQDLTHFERPAQALGGLLCVGAGVGLSNASAMAAAMSCIPTSAAASGAGAISTMRYLGGVLSILTLSLSARGVTELIANGRALHVFAAGSVAASAVALAVPNIKRRRPPAATT